MSEDPRIALIHRAFADFQARDLDGIAGFIHPEIECRVFPPLLNTGTWHGPAGFVEMTRGWEEAFGFIEYEVLDIELVDERNAIVAVRQHAAGAGSGVPVELDVFFLMEIADEQARRFQVHASRDTALRET